MNALIAVVACVVVLGLGVGAVHLIFGEWSWIPYCLVGFFGLMGLMAKLNAT